MFRFYVRRFFKVKNKRKQVVTIKLYVLKDALKVLINFKINCINFAILKGFKLQFCPQAEVIVIILNNRLKFIAIKLRVIENLLNRDAVILNVSCYCKKKIYYSSKYHWKCYVKADYDKNLIIWEIFLLIILSYFLFLFFVVDSQGKTTTCFVTISFFFFFRAQFDTYIRNFCKFLFIRNVTLYWIFLLIKRSNVY